MTKFGYEFFHRDNLLERKSDWKGAVDNWRTALANIARSDRLYAQAQTRLAAAEPTLARQKPVEVANDDVAEDLIAAGLLESM